VNSEDGYDVGRQIAIAYFKVLPWYLPGRSE